MPSLYHWRRHYRIGGVPVTGEGRAPAALIEKERRLGGVIRTDHVEGCLVEGGPDSFLASKPAAMDLIRELGLEADVIGSNDHQRVTSIVKGGHWCRCPTA